MVQFVGMIDQRPNDNRRANSLRGNHYQLETKRPIVCLAFILPLLFAYEIGSILLDRRGGKSGIDLWLQWVLDNAGIGQLVILPILTVGILITWHHRINDRWQIRPWVLVGMVIESAGLGFILFFAAKAVGQVAVAGNHGSLVLSTGCFKSDWDWWTGTIRYIGCGVYEELLFRLLLLNGMIILGQQFLQLGRIGTPMGIVFSSLVFASLHYQLVNPVGAEFDSVSFAFRIAASTVFCILYLFRGFGIAAGAHVTYDILTQL
jgi:hypothetical protein